MSTIKFNIQMFGGGSDWSAGVTKSAVDAAFDSFSAEIDATMEAIRDYGSVDAAFEAGWSGTDRDAYLEKFHKHAEDICQVIEEYRSAVQKQKDDIISNWESFQSGLIG